MSEQRMEYEEFLAHATPHVKDGYVCAPEVEECFNGVHAVTLSGPTGSGKGYTGEALGYDRVTGWSSRGKRFNEINGVHYWFVGNQESPSFERVLYLIENRLVAQAAIGSDGTNLYGSFEEDWRAKKGKRCTFDVVPETAREFRDLPLESLVNIYLTPKETNKWLQQKDDRNDGTGENDRNARLFEAHTSLAECLQDPGFYFVVNDGTTNHAADVVRRIVETGEHDLEYERRARCVGRTVLNQLELHLEKI